jgi:hypothetical protein
MTTYIVTSLLLLLLAMANILLDATARVSVQTPTRRTVHFLTVQFDVRYLWLGVGWDWKQDDDDETCYYFDLFICSVPLVIVHYHFVTQRV